jgi:hypothetical protein
MLGWLLVLNWFPSAVRWAALVLFCGFAGYSLRGVLEGRPACGCWGDVPVPSQATLAFDVLAIMVLCGALPSVRAQGWRPWQAALFRAGMAVSSLGLLSAGYWAAAQEVTNRPGDLAIFDPDKWDGRRLPFLDEIDIADELSRGMWAVLFHRRNCPHCEAVVARYEGHTIARPAGARVALIELPPYDAMPSVPLNDSHTNGPRRGRIAFKREWFIQTPCEIFLQDGEVVSNNSLQSDSLSRSLSTLH